MVSKRLFRSQFSEQKGNGMEGPFVWANGKEPFPPNRLLEVLYQVPWRVVKTMAGEVVYPAAPIRVRDEPTSIKFSWGGLKMPFISL